MPYNDSTLDYLDRLMQEETNKAKAGGSRDKLNNLMQHRREYEQQVRILDEYMEKGEDHKLLTRDGVNVLMQHLYGLKHYGESLRDMGKVIGR